MRGNFGFGQAFGAQELATDEHGFTQIKLHRSLAVAALQKGWDNGRDMADADVWVVDLRTEHDWLPPTPAEAERAARFVNDTLRRRHLRSHAALRRILGTYTAAPIEFALAEHGKPYLAGDRDLQFNLSHSEELAVVAVTRDVEIGVDVERFRPLQQCMAIAERFFPPMEAAALADVPMEDREAEFFRRWTRIEAKLKARGFGLYGAGAELDGDWSVVSIDVGLDYTASVAANCRELAVWRRLFPPSQTSISRSPIP
jgi:4'-phosphopantetheinyl transferase